MHPLLKSVAANVVATLLAGTWLHGAGLPPPMKREVDFAKDVRPLLQERCFGCHGPEKQKSGYRLDSREAALKGGDSGDAAILPGKSAESPLIQFVSGLDAGKLMPPKKSDKPRLTAEEIGVLRAWIDHGTVWPEDATVAKRDPLDWWSLKAITRPTVPETKCSVLSPQSSVRDVATTASKLSTGHWALSTNPIDAFISAKLAENGLATSPEADPRTLCRRLYFDLTGLPPTPEEISAFAADKSPDAYEHLVDKLLASPRHGECWARHWLDVVHYGDTHGYDKDKPRPNAWPYRDYVIRAFNDDKPYARFVQEQIAGDVLFPGTRDGIEALGFIAAGPWDYIGHAEVPETKVDGKIARHLDRDDMVANTIGTFCSATVHCAQCHNHKFDPITQEDYYSLQAVFAALDRTDRKYYADDKLNAHFADLTRQQRDTDAAITAVEEPLRKKAGAKFVELTRRIDGAS
ncbi:MAG: DUF1549 domain-containing protein, partial [Chthoniobacteraceae bacterium]